MGRDRYLACSLVLLTFYMKDMLQLRVAALCSNFAFLSYGIALHLFPVAILHAILIPMNGWRLLGLLRERGRKKRLVELVDDLSSPRSPRGNEPPLTA